MLRDAPTVNDSGTSDEKIRVLPKSSNFTITYLSIFFAFRKWQFLIDSSW